jgi:hypothetical protein
MSSSCAQWRGEIGAYVVGALDGRARDRVTGHLAECPAARPTTTNSLRSGTGSGC